MAYVDETDGEFVDDHGKSFRYDRFVGIRSLDDHMKVMVNLHDRASLKLFKLWIEDQLKRLSEAPDV